ncbi:hypothetical protein [Levilactobacillus brevis]|uniref:hypothetical protein n=1 Tax=Levilactobacillus brevis TaxID=1580 RepID=UPI001CDB0E8E|nr:hypothetical protein [Levilactobacillus brevis]
MKRYWQWILALGALLTFAGWHTTTAHAEGVGYTVSAKLPKNQDDKNSPILRCGLNLISKRN